MLERSLEMRSQAASLETGARPFPVCLEDEVSGWLFLRLNPWRSVGCFRSDPPGTSTRRVLDPSTRGLSSDLQVIRGQAAARVFFRTEWREFIYTYQDSRRLYDRPRIGSALMAQRVFAGQTQNEIEIEAIPYIVVLERILWNLVYLCPFSLGEEGSARAMRTMAGPASGEIQR